VTPARRTASIGAGAPAPQLATQEEPVSIHVPRPQSVSYPVRDDSKVVVQITVGDAQGGGWSIDLDDAKIQKGSGSAPVPIGDGKAIRGKELQVAVSVLDIRPETNRLSATVVIDGGTQGKQTVLQRYDDGDDGDLAIFTTLVDFT
jgi:hypothetical protein